MLDVADALEANQDLIKVENEADISEAQQAGYEKPLVSRLGLSSEKACSRFQYVNLCVYIYILDLFLFFHEKVELMDKFYSGPHAFVFFSSGFSKHCMYLHIFFCSLS